jgi:hypothetical protein
MPLPRNPARGITAADAIDNRDNVISGSAEKRFANPVIKRRPAKNLLQIALNQLQLSSMPRSGRSKQALEAARVIANLIWSERILFGRRSGRFVQ